METTIVVAVDVDEALGPIEPIVELAAATGWPVRLVHVMAPLDAVLLPAIEPGGSPMGSSARQQRRHHAQQVLDRWVEHVGSFGPSTEAVLLEGPTVPTLLTAAVDQGAAVLALFGRRHHVAHRILLGSVVSAVLREAPIPVLVLPPSEQFEQRAPLDAAMDDLLHVGERLGADRFPSEVRTAVQSAIAASDGATGSPSADDADEPDRSPLDRLRHVLHRFETDHPALTRTVNDVAYHLSGLGI